MIDEFLRLHFRGIEQEAPGDAAVILDSFEKLQLVLLSHARQSADFAFASQFLDPLEVGT